MLTNKQIAYIDYMLQNPTALDVDAHRELHIAKKTICAWHQQEEFQEEYSKALRRQWASYAKEAQKVLHGLMYSDRADVSLNAAKYVLSSCGYDAPEKIDVNANVNTIKVTITND